MTTELEAQTIAPHVTNLVQQFAWNYDEIKTSLDAKVEKYRGLVVTDTNVKDMETSQRELAGLRLSVDAFRKTQKKELEKPYKEFETQIKELVGLVEQAETPLKEQLSKYETARIQKETNRLTALMRKMGIDAGLRDGNEFFGCVIRPQWTKRTAVQKTVKKEIADEIDAALARQKQADDAAELERQKQHMIETLCASHSETCELVTPVTSDDVQYLLANATLGDIPGIVLTACERRQEMEQRASVPQADPVACVPQPITPPIAPPPAPNVAPPMGVPSFAMPLAAAEPKFIVHLTFLSITARQAQLFQQFANSNGIAFNIVSQEAAQN